jgi:hypothetical protein
LRDLVRLVNLACTDLARELGSYGEVQRTIITRTNLFGKEQC